MDSVFSTRESGRSFSKWLVGFSSLAAIAVISYTLAANISINGNSSTEFGQGILVTSTCDSYLIIKPKAVLVGNTFVLDSIELGDISTRTHDNSFTLQVYGETSSVGLLAQPAIIAVGANGKTFTKTSIGDNTTLETVTIDSSSPGGGANAEIGASVIKLTSITSDGSNKIPALQAVKYTLQSSGNGNCSMVYSVGDVGPAGGTIGITPSTPGNSTGKYFEIGTPSSGSMVWCGASDPGYSTALGTGTAIGTGAANTALIAANCTTGSGVYADQYTQGGYSDWFLPSAYELNAVKDVAPSGGYATSSERNATTGWYQNIPNGQPVLQDHAGKWFSLRSLPMRSFN